MVLVGDDPASKLYVGSKTRAFKRLDLVSETFNYPATISKAELLGVIDKLNADPRFHGILYSCLCPALSIQTGCCYASTP